MRGIKVTTKSGNSIVCTCTKCYEKEMDEIELAIEYNLIQKPIVTDIERCEVCCKKHNVQIIKHGD